MQEGRAAPPAGGVVVSPTNSPTSLPGGEVQEGRAAPPAGAWGVPIVSHLPLSPPKAEG
ncbi:hypothetical protein KDAU_37120 [Dictyobacter aurantiacus]|uniref:Uncharacterized protein n=1 Tax=Dictyobacter aurantiacus TaxID=1936993 RepID=A0A401ZHT5_9CHLR|nr:hypothetical protein KDAU_37120 [Dictyobacter aurantiacus]